MIKIWSKQGHCPILPDVRSYITLPYGQESEHGQKIPQSQTNPMHREEETQITNNNTTSKHN